MNDAIRLLARILLVAVFLGSAANKITHYSQTMGYMEKAGVPVPQAALPAAITVLVIGGLAVLTGFKARLGAALLLVFLFLATAYFHTDFSVKGNDIHLMKNAAIAGGLLMLVAAGPGRFALCGPKPTEGH
jgi:putative oxidoreductase